ncbi:MAG: hypothetical protein WBP90_07980 [Terracidiphilus sp.]
MENRVIDDYRLTAEIQYETAPLPIHLVATNTDDDSTTETWMTVEDLRAQLCRVCPSPDGDATVDGWMQGLENHHYTEFGAPQPMPVKGAARNRAIFKAEQLIPFGFSVSELRPFRLEKAS